MPRPFAPPGTATHYVPDRPVAVSHVRLNFEPDLAARSLRGQSHLSLTARRDGLDKVDLILLPLEFCKDVLNLLVCTSAFPYTQDIKCSFKVQVLTVTYIH